MRRLQLCQGGPILLRFYTSKESADTIYSPDFQISLQKTNHWVWGIIFTFWCHKYSCSIDFHEDFSSKNMELGEYLKQKVHREKECELAWETNSVSKGLKINWKYVVISASFLVTTIFTLFKESVTKWQGNEMTWNYQWQIWKQNIFRKLL